MSIQNQGIYLITGGCGALGLEVANWLVNKGAKYLLLIGRNKPSDKAKQTIDELIATGATIEIKQADITNYSQIETIINNLKLPLSGIIHAAGILDDGLLKNLTWERFQSVLSPKITGAWILHSLTQNQPLDFFICFSSIVSVIGSPGQANYAVANAFLDNLMQYRHSLGLPGLSVNWSIWKGEGMMQSLTLQQQQSLSQQGLQAITPKKALTLLERLLDHNKTQALVFPVDWQKFLTQRHQGINDPFFELIKPQNNPKSQTVITSFLQQLAITSPEKRKDILKEHIRAQLAKILGYSDPESIDTQENFSDLGMDSLMAVEFKNSLQASFGNVIPLTLAFDYPTVELLTDYLAKEILNSDLSNISPSEITLQDTTSSETAILPLTQSQLSQPTENIEIKPELRQNTITNRENIDIKPEYYQFSLLPEYLSLKKDLERVEELGNPFFTIHQGIARDTTKIDDRTLINFSSYNYLGLSGDPRVTQAAQDAIANYGTSVSASRLLSGEIPLHRQLETEIADFLGTEDAIIYIGGHTTNVNTIGHLFGKNDLILCDALSHNSIQQGSRLSGATIIEFPHNDYRALEQILAENRLKYQKVLIAIEGIYSTDGDIAHLPEIVKLKKQYKTFLLVDEAHSIGVLGISGRGIAEYYNIKPTDVDLWMGTLSKSLASCGGYIAGCREIVQYLKYTAPGFVFSVGMSPANTAAALESLRILKAEPERVITLQSRSQFCLNFAKSNQLNTGKSHNSPIIPIIVGEPHKAVKLSHALSQNGINVNPMVYPSVPYNEARLRLFMTCLHTEEQIKFTLNKIVENITESIFYN